MKIINELIYWPGKGKTSSCLNGLLQEVLGCAAAIFLMISAADCRNYVLHMQRLLFCYCSEEY